MSLNIFLNLIRYKNYLKNLLILLPLFLNYSSWGTVNYQILLTLLFFFSVLTSSVYIFNDLIDLDIDKKHRKKKFRPVTSGQISKKNAIYISLFLGTSSLLYFFYFSKIDIFIAIFTYLIINIFYSLILKKIKYLDLLIVSFGFFIRIYIGSSILDLTISNFFVLQIILFSIFILICKRREYFFSFDSDVYSKYEIKELDFLSKVFLILNISNYFIYLFNESRFLDSFSLELSFILFSFLIIRYFYITFKKNKFDPVSIFISDIYLIVFSIVYVLNFILGFNGIY